MRENTHQTRMRLREGSGRSRLLIWLTGTDRQLSAFVSRHEDMLADGEHRGLRAVFVSGSKAARNSASEGGPARRLEAGSGLHDLSQQSDSGIAFDCAQIFPCGTVFLKGEPGESGLFDRFWPYSYDFERISWYRRYLTLHLTQY